jgi:hypothetical protein
VCALLDHCGEGVTAAAQTFTDTVTVNVLRAFAAGPAARAHPAAGNLAGVRPERGTPYEGAPDAS